MTDLETLQRKLELAESTRDAAQAASNRDLIARREMAAKLLNTRLALVFAASVIKSGEPWTSTCEEIIGEVLRDS